VAAADSAESKRASVAQQHWSCWAVVTMAQQRGECDGAAQNAGHDDSGSWGYCTTTSKIAETIVCTISFE